MIEYFTEQIAKATPLTIETIDDMLVARKVCMSSAEYCVAASELQTRIGQKLLFYMLRSERGVEVLKIFDADVSTMLTYTFDRYNGSALPIFIENRG